MQEVMCSNPSICLKRTKNKQKVDGDSSFKISQSFYVALSRHRGMTAFSVFRRRSNNTAITCLLIFWVTSLSTSLVPFLNECYQTAKVPSVKHLL